MGVGHDRNRLWHDRNRLGALYPDQKGGGWCIYIGLKPIQTIAKCIGKIID